MTAERDSKTGRFLKGNAGGPGRPTRRGLVEALRDMTDADEMAAMLLRRAKKSDQVLMYIYDRLEGRPKQATELTGADGGPLEWLAMQKELLTAVKADAE